METKFNKHLRDFNNDFTMEYDVKNISCNISEEDMDFEQQTGEFLNNYAKACFYEIKKLRYNWIVDFSFAGRSNGWFCLLCDNKEIEKIRSTQLGKIETIIEKYVKDYAIEINDFYGENLT